MSEKYDNYLTLHKDHVAMAADWLYKNLPEIFNNDDDFKSDCMWQCKQEHDHSKYDPEEYEAYDDYFYGGNRSYEVVNRFNKAWLTHIHKNPHHWQHWVLLNDNPDEGEIILDMPDVYIIEMICDWWSFSWKQGKLDEIFKWYHEHKDYMKLSDKTRNKVEDILSQIYLKLSKSDANEKE